MSNSDLDKKQLKSIFEESLKEISSEGTDEFRRAVTEVLDEKKPGNEVKPGEEVKKDEPVKKENKPSGLNTPKI